MDTTKGQKKLELYYSVRPWAYSQSFYDDKACINPNNKKDFKSKIGNKCEDGYISLYNFFGYKSHGGIDVPAPEGTPIHASVNGWVKYIETEPERGLGVEIVTNEMFDFKKSPEKGISEDITCYVRIGDYHMKGVNVSLGQKVKVGDIIGFVGNTGYSTRSHDHYFCKLCDKNGETLFKENGWRGCFDPNPHFTWYYAEDQQKVIGILQSIIKLLKWITKKN